METFVHTGFLVSIMMVVGGAVFTMIMAIYLGLKNEREIARAKKEVEGTIKAILAT